MNNSFPYYINDRDEWLRNHGVPKMIECLKDREAIQLDSHQAFDLISSADPNAHKSLIEWITITYCSSGFSWEDIRDGDNSRVCKILTMFLEHKKFLHSRRKSIYLYKTLDEVYSEVKNFNEDKLRKIEEAKIYEMKRIEAEKIFTSTVNEELVDKDTYVLLDRKHLRIVIPLTRQAAQWWGKDTRWTGVDLVHNNFDSHNEMNPFMICLFKDSDGKDRKFQLWMDDDRFQFEDEASNPIIGNTEFWNNNYKIRAFIFPFILNTNAPALERISECLLTYDLCFIAVQQNGNILDAVPQAFKDYSLYTAACKSNGLALKYVTEICRDEELCRIAVQQDGAAIQWIPSAILTEELDEISIQTGSAIGGSISYHSFESTIGFLSLPEKLRTIDVYKQGLAEEGLAIQFIPTDIINEEMCFIACAQNGSALEYVPSVLKTKSLCKIAVGQRSSSLEWVPESLKSIELCMKACYNYCYAIRWVPRFLLTDEFCKLLCRNNGDSLAHIPNEFQTSEICMIAIEQNKDILFHIKREYRTKDICMIACEGNGLQLQGVPPELLSYDLCVIACKSDGLALRYVPENLKSRYIYIIACQSNGLALEYIPENETDTDMLQYAIRQNGRSIYFIPDRLRTKALIDMALEQYGGALVHVPRHLMKPNKFELKAREKISKWTTKEVQKGFDLFNTRYPYQSNLE